MSKLEIRLVYVDYPHTGLLCEDPSLTKQSFAHECDFNNVLSKWQESGLITHLNPSPASYGDVSHYSDYQTSLELIREAQASFDALPSQIRDRFNNDPAYLMSYLDDPSNDDEACSLGLLKPLSSAAAPVVGADSPTAKAAPSTGAEGVTP